MKKFIKNKIRQAGFKYLIDEKNTKSKIKDIKYKKFKLQTYINSNIFSNYEVEMLSKFRSRNIDVKSNFKKKFTFNNIENLQCSLENCYEEENQEHILKCKTLLEKLDTETKSKIDDIKYQDIFSNTKKQKKVITILIKHAYEAHYLMFKTLI